MFKKLLGAFVEFDEKEEPVEAVLQTTSAGLPVPPAQSCNAWCNTYFHGDAQ